MCDVCFIGQLEDLCGSDEDEELARETAEMCTISEVRCQTGETIRQTHDHNKRKHQQLDVNVSSTSSDDEVGEILRGGAWATPSAPDSSRLLRMSRHTSCMSPSKKHRRDVRPFLNFEKMRQSRFSVSISCNL